MANLYKCKEIDSKGVIVQNVYKAESEEEVRHLIIAKGSKPLKVELEMEKPVQAGGDLFQKRVKTKELAIFCKQMHTMLNAGMPLITALEVLGEQTEHLVLRETLKRMTVQVQKGDILSVAMKQHPHIFPVLLINMVEAGELTGNLDNVLERMSVHYVKENKINNRIKGAMIYPIVLSILSVTVVTFLLVFIMPTFVGMFESANVTLPTPTRILMGFSKSIKSFWYLYILGIAGIVFAFKAFKKSAGGKRFIDQTKLRFPMIKKPMAQIITSRFTRTLSTLMASGIPLLQSLEASANVTNNAVIIEGMVSVSSNIQKGTPLSKLLKEMRIFPPMMISMVSIGEESGALEEMLEKTADYYDEELETALQKMISILEPLMIIIMAVVVGFIVIAMVMPMFDMMKTVA